jgi:uncharacterized protein (TIGR00255 family)
MTAFAHQRSEFPWGNATWELRSVNHRYLELSFKLPESWRHLEPKLRDELRALFQRGKLECSLKLQLQEEEHTLSLNSELANQIIDSAQSLRDRVDNPAPLNLLELLRWPGVIRPTELDGEAIGKDLMQSFVTAIQEQLANRHREGDALAALIQSRLEQISTIVADVRARMPGIIEQQRSKLIQRVAELKVELDNDRLEQEVALIAQKADVDEELDRLDTHVAEVKRVLKKGGACGRRLDFLMQELNREANTLSSKAVVTDNTQAAVELKVLIEQMREQIQNIE